MYLDRAHVYRTLDDVDTALDQSTDTSEVKKVLRPPCRESTISEKLWSSNPKERIIG